MGPCRSDRADRPCVGPRSVMSGPATVNETTELVRLTWQRLLTAHSWQEGLADRRKRDQYRMRIRSSRGFVARISTWF